MITRLVGALALAAALSACAAPRAALPALPTLSCSDFQHNPDRSWSVLRPTVVGGVTMAKGAILSPGSFTNGVDFAADLGARCGPK